MRPYYKTEMENRRTFARNRRCFLLEMAYSRTLECPLCLVVIQTQVRVCLGFEVLKILLIIPALVPFYLRNLWICEDWGVDKALCSLGKVCKTE